MNALALFVTVVRLVQFCHTPVPRVVTPAGIVNVFKDVQVKNAVSPIDVMVVPSEQLVIDVQFLKALAGTLVKDDAVIVTVFNAVHPVKVGIVVKPQVPEIDTLVNFVLLTVSEVKPVILLKLKLVTNVALERLSVATFGVSEILTLVN